MSRTQVTAHGQNDGDDDGTVLIMIGSSSTCCIKSCVMCCLCPDEVLCIKLEKVATRIFSDTLCYLECTAKKSSEEAEQHTSFILTSSEALKVSVASTVDGLVVKNGPLLNFVAFLKKAD